MAQLDVYWENSPPADIVDRLGAAFPRVMAIEFYQRQVKRIAEVDKFRILFLLLFCITLMITFRQGTPGRFT